MMTRVLRGAAVAIAVAAAIDPSFTSSRPSHADVVVIPASPIDSAAVARVRRALASRFTVLNNRLSGAAATVVVGRTWDGENASVSGAAVSVIPARADIAITYVNVPEIAAASARVPIDATLRIAGERGRSLRVTLRAGPLAMDVATRQVPSDDATITVPLTFVPADTGAQILTVEAEIEGSARATASEEIDVRARSWNVLSFDARPSWMSTFVRRAVARDDRFAVTSRVATSRNNIVVAAGAPPAALDDSIAMSHYDVVLVGAPEALTQRDVDGLDRFMRDRKGSVILLFDQHADGPYQKLPGFPALSATTSAKPIPLPAPLPDSGQLVAAEIEWPVRLPVSASIVASAPPAPSARASDSAARRPVIWWVPLGGGRLIVSGALDAWRFRDSTASTFDAFWRNVVANAADAVPRRVALTIAARGVPQVGRPLRLSVAQPDAAAGLASRSWQAAVKLSAATSNDTAQTIKLWPSAVPGEFTATLPAAVGSYRIDASLSGAQTTRDVIVAAANAELQPPTPDDSAALAAWAKSRGGATISAADIGELPGALERAIRPLDRREEWHPMRSVWWLLPFVGCLCAEWFSRRRKGLA